MAKSRINDKIDEMTGLPYLTGAYGQIKEELDKDKEVGFLYFDVVQFRQLEEKYGFVKCQELLKLLGDTLRKQKGLLYRDDDLVVIGGKGLDYFILFLFSPPRKKGCFTNHDLKLISTRIRQKLKHVVDENADILDIDESIDFHTGYTVIRKDPYMQIERLIYEARKEAGSKSQLESIMVEFISNVSHELRTPLTSIKGYAETLLEGAMNDQGLCSRWLQIIYDESKRLERLINDLLDLSMLEAEQVDLSLQPADVACLIENCVSIIHPLAVKEEINITTSFDVELPKPFMDEDRMKQVMLNLLHNAVKYSPRGGEVNICAKKLDREIEISVYDYGCGIPKNHLDKIFERFYRGDKVSSGKAAGRGLGLAIARHIVETHGGTIGVKSKVGEGSQFYFTLPLDIVIGSREDGAI